MMPRHSIGCPPISWHDPAHVAPESSPRPAPEPQYGQSGVHHYEIRRTPESVTADARAAVQEYARLWAEIDARPRIRHPWSAP